MNEPLKQIKLLLLDVDGVLTDGSITYTDAGEQIKTFNSSDGLGIRLLMDAGIQVGIITGRSSGALKHRCRNLNISILHDGTIEKAGAIEDIARQTGIAKENMGFVGDDLLDGPAMKLVGTSFAVANACPEIKECADRVTTACGGHGAVREVCESILKAAGHWPDIINRYLP